MISSPGNAQVKTVRRLQSDRRFRQREQAFVTEGSRWLLEWLAQPALVQRIYYTPDWAADRDNARLLAHFASPAIPVADVVLEAMSDTTTAPGVLVVAEQPSLPWPDQGRLFLVLDAVATPGNMGTILRTAAAAGVDGILLGPGCVDPYNPKVVRGGMGAHLRIPVLAAGWPEIAERVRRTQVWLAEAGADQIYSDVDWTKPSTLLVGNEAHGPGAQASRLEAGAVAIPMAAETESLNAAVAASVVLFEAARQNGFRSRSTV